MKHRPRMNHNYPILPQRSALAVSTRAWLTAAIFAGAVLAEAHEAIHAATHAATHAASQVDLAVGHDRQLAVAAVVPAGAAFASDHILVQLAPGVRVATDAKGLAVLRSSHPSTERTSRKAFAEGGVSAVRSVFVAPPKDAATAFAIGLDRWYRCELAAGSDARAAVARIGALKGVVAHAELDPEGGVAEIPNDADFWIQYALRNTAQTVGGVVGIAGADIGMANAWTFTHGDPNLVIAVLDSGIDPHPELAGRILPGINIPDGTTITTDECGHGTHVAGILAATGNNGVGIAGVTWNAKLLPVVVVNGCSGFEANVASGVTWAVDQGARLLNMSLQFYTGSLLFQQAIQYAHAQGAILVAATGNNNSATIAAPARWNEVIAVASTDNRDLRSSFSNFGAETDICAPGTNVWSLSGSSGYTLKSGTSMSTPHVTAVAALLWSYSPSLTRDEVRGYLVSTARDLGTPGLDPLYGAGRLDAAAALAAVPLPYPPEDINQDGAVNAADLSLLLSAWGVCADCDGGCPADLNGDCVVGGPDLSILLAAW